MPTAIDQIYDQITQVLGGTNSSQVLTMLMPGTALNAQTYAYDTTVMKPALVQQAESELTDQMFDLAKVSASSNGQRVSSQFMQALSVLIPNFNPLMPLVKDNLRDFLNTQMPANTTLDGIIPFTGTFQQYYFTLYDNYIEKKMAWEQMIVTKQGDLAKDPATESEKYLEWYEQIAEGMLAEIDQALGKVLAVFAPSDMDAILGTLAAGPGGELYEATNAVKDIQLASPDGGYFYPVELLPNDWFLDLASDLNPINLLQDPQFIAVSITAKREALMASISQVQALVNSMPTQGDIKTAADALTKAQGAYSTAQGALLNTYADNTATAVEMYLQNKANNSSTPTVSDLNALAVEASTAKGESPVATGATTKSGTAITAADVQTLVAGQKTLIQAQSNLLSTSQGLANAGVTLAAMQSGNFGDLPVILARLQAQLAEIVSLQSDLSNSFVVTATGANALPTLGPAMSIADQQSAKAALMAAQAVMSAATTAASVTQAEIVNAIKQPLKITGDTSSEPSLQPIYDAVNNLKSSSSFSKKNELTAYKVESNGSTDEKSELLVDNKKAHSSHSVAHSTDTKALSMTKPVAGGPAVSTDLAMLTTPTAPTGEDALKALMQAVKTHANLPQAKQSDASQRFMELQMSFSSSDMEDTSSVVSSSSQSSWSVDLFFGSASGSSSSSSSVTAKNSFDSSTEIKVGMKVAKVDIQRGWLDPGIFKLSKDMSRLSSDLVSTGGMPINSDDGTQDWSNVKNMNMALFPAFPVAFIIAKDINLTFQANESSLAAVHSVVDSRSATGGGFLCFGGSSSSASHSDHSSMSVKSSGSVVNISMPGAQILGWYLELTPEDQSVPLTNASVAPATDASAADINILQFLNQLNALKGTLLS